MSLLIMAPFNNNKKLSELVKLYPCLYNKQEKDLKKEDIKQRAWNEIVKELNISNQKEAEPYWQCRCIWCFSWNQLTKLEKL